jgi:Rhodopirellula transposase DDE domain
VHKATGSSMTTIRQGIADLESAADLFDAGRVRAVGGGRKKLEVSNPALPEALESLIEPETRGDPESPIRWTTKSTRNLADELTEMGHRISHPVVAEMLRSQGYSLQSNRKTREGKQHPDRDAQFRYINGLAKEFMAVGDPVISVDTKKKELVGEFAQAGREWQRTGQPVEVSAYDFPTLAEGKAIPYGVYDIADDSGWVSVGIDHDTSVFAVATIEQWWLQVGKARYPNARRILISADGGGSNGHRPWLWKRELARLSADTGLEIHVCHFPPGTSKWNKIEHRMFSRISLNWRARPLVSYQTIVSLIASTTTKTGLVIQCDLDQNLYPTKIKVTKKERDAIPIVRHEFHGEWNYTIKPRLE